MSRYPIILHVRRHAIITSLSMLCVKTMWLHLLLIVFRQLRYLPSISTLVCASCFHGHLLCLLMFRYDCRSRVPAACSYCPASRATYAGQADPLFTNHNITYAMCPCRTIGLMSSNLILLHKYKCSKQMSASVIWAQDHNESHRYKKMLLRSTSKRKLNHGPRRKRRQSGLCRDNVGPRLSARTCLRGTGVCILWKAPAASVMATVIGYCTGFST